jgi:hypothetical protein
VKARAPASDEADAAAVASTMRVVSPAAWRRARHRYPRRPSAVRDRGDILTGNAGLAGHEGVPIRVARVTRIDSVAEDAHRRVLRRGGRIDLAVEPRTRVTDLQPFKDPDGLRWLSLFHGLDIADKHHVLGRGVTAPTRADLTVAPGMAEVLAQGSRVEVEDGTEVMRFRIADAAATPEVSLRAGFQFAAFFGDAGFKAAPGAISLWSYGVRDIIESFASDFR